MIFLLIFENVERITESTDAHERVRDQDEPAESLNVRQNNDEDELGGVRGRVEAILNSIQETPTILFNAFLKNRRRY